MDTFGSSGSKDGELDNPTYCAIKVLNLPGEWAHLWVCDSGNNRVQKFIINWEGEITEQVTIANPGLPQVTAGFPEESNTNVNKYDSTYYARAGSGTSFKITFSQEMSNTISPTVKFITEDGYEYVITQTFYSNNIWLGTNTIPTGHDGTAQIYVSGAVASTGSNLSPDPDTGQTFIIDTTPPSITIYQPSTPTTSTNIQASGTTEPEIFIDMYNFTTTNLWVAYSSNKNIQADMSGNFSAWLKLITPKETTNWITGRARDKAGNWGDWFIPRRKVLCINAGVGTGYVSPSTNKKLGDTGDPNLKLIWTADTDRQDSTFIVEIPMYWASPSKAAGDAGHVYISDFCGITFVGSPTNLQVSNQKVKVCFSSANVGGFVELTYGTNNKTMVSNNAAIGLNHFEFTTINNDPGFKTNWNLSKTVPSPPSESQDIEITGEPLRMKHSSCIPQTTYKGQSMVSVMTLFFTNANALANDKIERLIFTTENSNNIGIVPSTALSKIALYIDDNLFYQDNSIETSGDMVTVDFSSTPLSVSASTLIKVIVKVDIDNDATAESLKLNLKSGFDVIAKDENSGILLDVIAYGGDSFPMRSAHCMIQSYQTANRILTSFSGNGDRSYSAGRNNVNALRLTFTSTNSNVNEVQITSIKLKIENVLNNGIIPSLVIEKVTVQETGNGPIYLQDTTIENTEDTIYLDLFASSLYVSPDSSVSVNIRLDILSSTSITNFHIGIIDATNITARDKVILESVTNYADSGYSFPMCGDDIEIAKYFKIVHDGTATVNEWEKFTIQAFNTNGCGVTNFTGSIRLYAENDSGEIEWTNISGAGSFTNYGIGNDSARYSFHQNDNNIITLAVRDNTAESINLEIYDWNIRDNDIEGYLTFSSGYSNVHNLTLGLCYSNITSALAEASNSHIIEVHPGVYNENVDLSGFTNLTLQAYVFTNSGDNTNTVIDASGHTYGIVMTNGYRNTILGFTVKNASQHGIYITGISSSNFIEFNRVYSNNSKGIALWGGNVNYNTVRSNIVYWNADGIRLENANYNKCIGNISCNNTNDGISSDGIVFFGTSISNYITGNVIYSNSGPGIASYSANGDYNIITNNAIYGCNYGMHINVGNYNLIIDNKIKFNGSAGIRFDSTDNKCFYNSIYSNIGTYGIFINGNNTINYGNTLYENFSGIYINSRDNIIIQSNIIYNSGTGIYIVNGSDNAIISNNYIANSTNYGIYAGEGNGLKVNLNTVVSNDIGIIYSDNIVNPDFTANNIFSNTLINFTNGSGTIVNMTNVWWGTTIASSIASKIFNHNGYSNFIPYRLFGPFNIKSGEDIIPPPIVSNLSANVVSTTNVALSWDSSSGAVRYFIYRTNINSWSNFTRSKVVGITSLTNWTNYNVPDGTLYYYVTALDSAPYTNECWYSTNVMINIDRIPPTKVSVISPTNNIWTNTQTIGFLWFQSTDASSGVTNYQLQITNHGTGWSTNIITINTNCTVNNIVEGTNYWYVRAKDKAGNYGAWSSTNILKIDVTSPAVSLTSPASNSISGSLSVSFLWSVSETLSGITNQKIDIDINNNIGDGFEIQVYTNSPYDYTFSGNGTNHWRVWLEDRAGNTNYSSIWNLIINTNSGVAALYRPLMVCTNINNPEFVWSDESGNNVTSNIIQIDNANDFSSIDRQNSGGASFTNWTVNPALTTDQYYWRVLTYRLSTTTWFTSQVSWVWIDTNNPGAVTLIDPSNNEILTNTSGGFDLTWSKGTDVGTGVTNYTLQITNLNTAWSTNLLLTGTNINIPTNEEGIYNWFVINYDKANNLTISVTNIFSIDTNPPLKVILIAPTNNTVTNENNIEFIWNNTTDVIAGVTNYRLQVTNTTLSWSTNIITTNTNYFINNLSSGTLYWNVRAMDVVGHWSEDSATNKLTIIDTVAPYITNVKPVDGSINVAVESNIYIYFSETMRVDSTNCFILKFSNNIINGVFTWQSNNYYNDTLVFDAALNLSYNTFYTVIISTNAFDNDGNRITKGSNIIFKTVNETNKITIISLYPLNGSVGVPVGLTIQIQFSGSMDPSSTNAFFISPSVSGSFSWQSVDYVNDTLLFQPSNNLPYVTVFTCTVTTNAISIYSNRLIAETNFIFTTESDTYPPGNVLYLRAFIVECAIHLNWQNSSDADFAGTVIYYRTDGRYPQYPGDGIMLCNRTASSGTQDAFIHSDVQIGIIYFYTAFTYDILSNYSIPNDNARVQATLGKTVDIMDVRPNVLNLSKNGFIKIMINLSEQHDINIEIYNIAGEMIKKITPGQYQEYEYLWYGIVGKKETSGVKAAPGAYFVVFQSNKGIKKIKVFYVVK